MQTEVSWGDASQMALGVNNTPDNSGDKSHGGLTPGPGSSPGGGNGSPLQYSCLENPMGRGTWQAAVHRVTKNQTKLK